MVAGFDATVSYIALPTIKKDLQLDVSQAQWFQTITQVAKVSFSVPLGLVGYKIGATYSLIIYTAIQIACYLSVMVVRNYYALLFIRLVTGMIAAGTLINTLFITQSLAPDEQRKLFSKYQLLTVAIADSLAQTISGFIIQYAGWQYIYLICAISAFIRGVNLLFFPNIKQNYVQFDYIGAFLLVAQLAHLCSGMTFMAQGHYALGGGMIGVSLVLLALFVVQQKYSAIKLIDISLFRNKIINIILVEAAIYFINNSESLVIPFMADQNGMGAVVLGIQNTARTVFSVIASVVFIKYNDHRMLIGFRPLFASMIVSLVLVSLQTALLGVNYYAFASIYVVKYFFLSSATQLVSPIVQSQVDVKDVGRITGVSAMLNNLASCIAQTISGSIVDVFDGSTYNQTGILINYCVLVGVSVIILFDFIGTFSGRRQASTKIEQRDSDSSPPKTGGDNSDAVYQRIDTVENREA